MYVDNKTVYDVKALLEQAVDNYNHSELVVEIKYCPAGSKRAISGTYYRRCPKAPNGGLIRLRINRTNKYPVSVPFKTSEYFKKLDSKGREVVYQRLRVEKFTCPEHLLVAIFLHEFSHYLDHIEGRNGRYKQTKADRFAVEVLTKLNIVSQ
ncbi:MAG TPA: hypothetical protein PLU88_05105 [Armatimonadota bacterium]|nr:hypothetical protein [Armatimonadota bacterium]HPP74487.1 hypothetical protein [Armatimonadota bacterium]